MRLSKFLPEQLIFRRAISVTLVVVIITMISHFFSLSEKFWMTITAILVLQTAVGLTLRQGLQRFLMMICSVVVGSFIALEIKQNEWVYVMAVIFISIGCYFSSMSERAQSQIVVPLMMGIAVVMTMLLRRLEMQEIQARMLDIIAGGAVGLVTSLLIFPVRADVEFRKEVLPLLDSMLNYFQAIINSLYDPEAENNLIKQRRRLESIWQEFPDWVYEAGFVARLQQGHRHFLVRIEQIRQILFVLNYLAGLNYDKEILEQLKEPMNHYADHVSKMIRSISTVLTLKQLSEGAEDLTDSFNQLEAAFQRQVPYSLESLDINMESVSLANFIYELQELGKLLTVLARALR